MMSLSLTTRTSVNEEGAILKRYVPPPLFDADDGPQVMIDDDVSQLVC